MLADLLTRTRKTLRPPYRWISSPIQVCLLTRHLICNQLKIHLSSAEETSPTISSSPAYQISLSAPDIKTSHSLSDQTYQSACQAADKKQETDPSTAVPLDIRSNSSVFTDQTSHLPPPENSSILRSAGKAFPSISSSSADQTSPSASDFKKTHNLSDQLTAACRAADKSKETSLAAVPLDIPSNRPFSKMAAENLNKSKLKTNTSTRKSTFTLVTLQSFSISGEISAEKICSYMFLYVQN